MKRTMLSLGAALALTLPWAFLGVPTASAVLVTDWIYLTQAGFSAFAPDPGVDDSLIGSLGTPTRLDWGVSTGSGRSALELGEPNTGPLVTGGPSVLDITITHENRPITGTTLTSATITGSLTLTPVLPVPGAPIPAGSIPFSIAFEETLNTAPCGFPSVSVCDDIFVLTSPGFPLTFPFFHDGEGYLITLTVGTLGPLPDTTCEAAGVAGGCFGLTTPEGADSFVEVLLEIDAAPIPEPSTILLLGSGLAALTLYARRKVSKKVKETA